MKQLFGIIIAIYGGWKYFAALQHEPYFEYLVAFWIGLFLMLSGAFLIMSGPDVWSDESIRFLRFLFRKQ